MSTVTVVKKDGWAAIAADTLTTYGSNQETAKYIVNHSKIIQVGESYLAVCGPASAQHALLDYFNKHTTETCFESVGALFRIWLEVHESLKEQYFLLDNKDEEDSFESSEMDVLIANPYGIFGIDRHRAAQEYGRFYATGSGSRFATGAMYAVYEESSKSAEEIARLGVECAAEFHSGTGLPVISYAIKLKKKK